MSETSVGDVVARAVADGVGRLLANEAAARSRESDGVEGVHQMRVATRRLRSDLRTFRSAIDRQWAAGLRAELSWLAELLGDVRDADVLSQRLAVRIQELDAQEARGADARAAADALATLTDQRTSAYASLFQALESERYRTLLARLDEAVRVPQLTEEASLPASDVLPRLMRRAWRALDRKARSLSDPPSDAELHRVRIAAKRCRYAAEACAPTLGKPTRGLARATKALQEVLGELSDAVSAEHWLREWAQRSASNSGAFVAGELVSLERAAASQARSEWPKAWDRVAAAAADVFSAEAAAAASRESSSFPRIPRVS